MTRDIFKRGNLAADVPAGSLPIDAETPAIAHVAPAMPELDPVQRTKTAPGGVANFMVQRSEAHKEVEVLKQRLKAFDGAVPAQLLNPAEIRDSAWANRHEASFQTNEFADFKEEIRIAGGNIQAIKVRRLAVQEKGVSPGNTPIVFKYEVVFGHRRRRACFELGLPVLALIEGEMDDRALFVEMYRENMGRADLTPWEQGVMHAQAISSGLFSSVRQLAKAVGQDAGTISKALTLVNLPKAIVSAFNSPLVLQYRWVAPLNEALQKDPDAVIERANELTAQQGALRAAAQTGLGETEVLAQLLGLPSSRVSPEATWIEVSGKRVARLKVDATGRPSVEFKFAMTATRREALERLVREFLMAK